MSGRPSGDRKTRLFFGSRIALIASEKHNQINSERIHNKPERQPKSIACPVVKHLSHKDFGAGGGNRTRVWSLGSCRSAIELRPLIIQ